MLAAPPHCLSRTAAYRRRRHSPAVAADVGARGVGGWGREDVPVGLAGDQGLALGCRAAAGAGRGESFSEERCGHESSVLVQADTAAQPLQRQAWIAVQRRRDMPRRLPQARAAGAPAHRGLRCSLPAGRPVAYHPVNTRTHAHSRVQSSFCCTMKLLSLGQMPPDLDCSSARAEPRSAGRTHVPSRRRLPPPLLELPPPFPLPFLWLWLPPPELLLLLSFPELSDGGSGAGGGGLLGVKVGSWVRTFGSGGLVGEAGVCALNTYGYDGAACDRPLTAAMTACGAAGGGQDRLGRVIPRASLAQATRLGGRRSKLAAVSSRSRLPNRCNSRLVPPPPIFANWQSKVGEVWR